MTFIYAPFAKLWAGSKSNSINFITAFRSFITAPFCASLRLAASFRSRHTLCVLHERKVTLVFNTSSERVDLTFPIFAILPEGHRRWGFRRTNKHK